MDEALGWGRHTGAGHRKTAWGHRTGNTACRAGTSHRSHIIPAPCSLFHGGRLSLGEGLFVLKATEPITVGASTGVRPLHGEALRVAKKHHRGPRSALEGI